MTSSSRFENSGLKVRFTSFLTSSSILSISRSSRSDWKPRPCLYDEERRDVGHGQAFVAGDLLVHGNPSDQAGGAPDAGGPAGGGVVGAPGWGAKLAWGTFAIGLGRLEEVDGLESQMRRPAGCGGRSAARCCSHGRWCCRSGGRTGGHNHGCQRSPPRIWPRT